MDNGKGNERQCCSEVLMAITVFLKSCKTLCRLIGYILLYIQCNRCCLFRSLLEEDHLLFRTLLCLNIQLEAGEYFSSEEMSLFLQGELLLILSLILSLSPLFYTFLKSGIDKSTEWSTIPACLSLMCFFNRGDTEGTNSSKILCPMFVYVLFYVNLCHD